MRPYLIIGGAGFIGTALTKQLGAESVHIFDNYSPIVHDSASIRSHLKLGTDVTVGDVAVRSDVEMLLDKGTPEVVYYLAAETGTGRSLQNCVLNAKVNTLGLANVLDGLSRRGVFPKQFILTSTRAVYGEGPYFDRVSGQVSYPSQRKPEDLTLGKFDFDNQFPLDMNAGKHFPNPINIYGSTKLSQENLLENWCRSFDVSLSIVRLQNVYGAGQSVSNPYTGVLIHFINSLLDKQPIHIFEQGGITRDFVHVDDVARLLEAAGKMHGNKQKFDCGSGMRVKLEDVAESLIRIAGHGKLEFNSEFRIGDVRHASADIAPTIAQFNWKPEVDQEQALIDLFSYVTSLRLA